MAYSKRQLMSAGRQIATVLRQQQERIDQLNPPRVYLKRHLPRTAPRAPLVLVHNHVRPTRTFGTRGFSAWTEPHGLDHVLCDCGWARRRIAKHYRMATEAERERRVVEVSANQEER